VTCRTSGTSFPEIFYSLPKSQLPTVSDFFIMSTDWSLIFDETLTKYLQQYIVAEGDSAARAQVLKNCEEDITKSSLHDKEVIELPQHLCWVSISSH
jgi:hypothetical protein